MQAAPHIFVGAAVGALVFEGINLLVSRQRPNHQITLVAALAGGVVSHMALDSIPHGHYGSLSIFQPFLILILVVEIILAGMIIKFWGCIPKRSPRNVMIAAGAVAGAAPDFFVIAFGWFDRFTGTSHAFSRLFFFMHGYWHTTLEDIPFVQNLMLFVLVTFCSLALLNSTRQKYILDESV